MLSSRLAPLLRQIFRGLSEDPPRPKWPERCSQLARPGSLDLACRASCRYIRLSGQTATTRVLQVGWSFRERPNGIYILRVFPTAGLFRVSDLRRRPITRFILLPDGSKLLRSIHPLQQYPISEPALWLPRERDENGFLYLLL